MAAPRVTPVDISGGASTVENDELTTGAASLAKAYVAASLPIRVVRLVDSSSR